MINRILKVGDKVWLAQCKQEEVTETCPVCFGKKQVVIILGDGSHIGSPCDYCGNGFEESRGYVREYRRITDPKFVTISSVTIKEEAGKTEYEYRFDGCYCVNLDNTFETEEEAKVRSAVLEEEWNRNEERLRAHRKRHNIHKISWRVGYHMKGLKENRRQAEYHERQIAFLKKKGSA